MMNNSALNEFLCDVYSDDNKTVLSGEEVKEIEKFYKENYKNVNTFSEC